RLAERRLSKGARAAGRAGLILLLAGSLYAAYLALGTSGVAAGSLAVPPVLAAPQDPPTPGAATLKLVSPASGKGPAGAHLTLAGDQWTGSSVSLSTATGDCAGATTQLGTAAVNGGAFTTTVLWPTSLADSGTTYTLCAQDGTGASATASYFLGSAT